ncbi:thiamine phosphate synthase [Ammoniphilus resinae]|uniref:Thiamine-phosphate synthase n=1 Tax=Ammoniphilus resinae TaxID=861532 RepID=A0ABS4GQ48_9BACL|nr:thiamine phosphate synthase [Ammoniphilus resinae]MBP1932396.1 thiamine-phosphate pyrophosphorylase [Ammoniphilus resinae]
MSRNGMDSEKVRAALRVYFIAGSQDCLQNPVDVLKQALAGGITMFQFREKGKAARTGEQKLELAKELQALCQSYGVPFIVNDDLELALALDADGVHVGQEDELASVVRERMGPDKILGVSAHTAQEARQAMADGADYIGVGPIFPTQSKADAKEVKGPEGIIEFRQSGIQLPIVGIGGITLDNAHLVMQAGADGVSVISAITHATSIEESAKRFSHITSGNGIL